MGCSKNTLRLEESGGRRGTRANNNQKTSSHSFVESFSDHYEVALHTYLGSYERGAELALAAGDSLSKRLPGHPLFPADTFYRGMVLFAMARKTGSKCYSRQAMKCLAPMKRFAKVNPNTTHYEVLLDAEFAALKKKYKLAERFYQAASATASQAGCEQDEAFATERFACFLLEVKGDKTAAQVQLRRAVELYQSWGATKKVQMLSSEYADIMTE